MFFKRACKYLQDQSKQASKMQDHTGGKKSGQQWWILGNYPLQQVKGVGLNTGGVPMVMGRRVEGSFEGSAKGLEEVVEVKAMSVVKESGRQ